MRTAVGALVLAAGVGLVLGPAAQADVSVPAPYQLVDSCPGSLVDEFPKSMTNRAGQTAGRVELYYSPANGGTNCLIVRDGDNDDTRHFISATLRREDLSYRGEDSGNYKHYAGGVLVPQANGRCVYVTAKTSWPQPGESYQGNWGPVACG